MNKKIKINVLSSNKELSLNDLLFLLTEYIESNSDFINGLKNKDKVAKVNEK